MKRTSARSPPFRGAGAPRTSGGGSDGGAALSARLRPPLGADDRCGYPSRRRVADRSESVYMATTVLIVDDHPELSGRAHACCSRPRATTWWARPADGQTRGSRRQPRLKLPRDVVLLDIRAARHGRLRRSPPGLTPQHGSLPAVVLISSPRARETSSEAGGPKRRARLHPEIGALGRRAGGADRVTAGFAGRSGPRRAGFIARRGHRWCLPLSAPDDINDPGPHRGLRAAHRLVVHRHRAVSPGTGARTTGSAR